MEEKRLASIRRYELVWDEISKVSLEIFHLCVLACMHACIYISEGTCTFSFHIELECYSSLHIYVQGNISMDGEGELLFSDSAEHLMDYEPLVEDDHGKKQKLSPKRPLPESTAKKSPKRLQRSLALVQSSHHPRNVRSSLLWPLLRKKLLLRRKAQGKKNESPLTKNARKSTSKKAVPSF
jgi:hypothetical protein